MISVTFFFLFQNSSVTKILTDNPLYDKLQLESLSYIFFNSDVSSSLLDYEGNSRSGIVESFLGEMSSKDFLFGNGIFATYSAFVERNTIEIGWIQELFWFGIPFVFISIYLFIKSAYLNFRSIESYK